MLITLYRVEDDPRVVNKTLSNASLTIDAKCTDAKDILNPEFVINLAAQVSAKYNYMRIPEFNRYYFITDMAYDTAQNLVISAHVDVLKTYADSIPSINGMITRSSNANGEKTDSSLPVNEYAKELHLYTIPTPVVSLLDGIANPDTLLFAT